ncbi:hypothetical protein [Paenibacillus sp. FSL M7-1046]|uniref:Uncharacterized protein n=1 Tax=Paenibacillus borealis TaxID=160799 RepID=A0ABX3HQG5_PAEBO|nr:hypothetical protein BSK56_02315 [Paenibacillus borealis]
MELIILRSNLWIEYHNMGPEIFNAMLDSVGSSLKNLSKLSLLAGIAFLVWAEIEEYYKTHNKNNNIKNAEPFKI